MCHPVQRVLKTRTANAVLLDRVSSAACWFAAKLTIRCLVSGRGHVPSFTQLDKELDKFPRVVDGNPT